MILVILKWKIDLRKALFNWRLKRAIRKAKKWSNLLNKKFLVISYNGKPRAYQKAELKDLIKRRQFYKKGTTIEQLEKMAFFITQ